KAWHTPRAHCKTRPFLARTARGRAAPLPARVRRPRPGGAPRDRAPRRCRRCPALRRALPAAADGPRRRHPRDASARRLLPALPRTPRRRRRIRVLRRRDPEPEQRRRRAPRAAPPRRGGHGGLVARARLPEGRPARELGRRLAVRLLPRAGGEAV